jgi:hypothetical protein
LSNLIKKNVIILGNEDINLYTLRETKEARSSEKDTLLRVKKRQQAQEREQKVR